MQQKLSRRDFLRLTGAAAAGTLLPVGHALFNNVGGVGALQATGNAVVMAIGTEPQGLDTCNPWNLGSGLWGMLNLPYDSWWVYDREMNIQPSAATGWTR